MRLRHDRDAGLTCLEVALKTLRDETVKNRLALPGAPDASDDTAMAFVDACHCDL